MEITAIFLVLAVLSLVGIYLYAPFMAPRRRSSRQESHEVSSLMAERDRVVNSLQELDFDFNLGKVPAEDYPQQRADLLQKGAQILRQLDELAPSSTRAFGRANGADATEDRIEKAVAARRADAASKASDITEDDIESMIAARRKLYKDRSAGFCPRCGKPILVSDRFCPSCGKSLT